METKAELIRQLLAAKRAYSFAVDAEEASRMRVVEAAREYIQCIDARQQASREADELSKRLAEVN